MGFFSLAIYSSDFTAECQGEAPHTVSESDKLKNFEGSTVFF